MANSINVSIYPKFDTSKIEVYSLSNIPFLGLMKGFWSGTEEELKIYLEEKKIPIINSFASLYEAEDYATKISQIFIKSFARDSTDKFNYRLASVIKEKYLKNGFHDNNYNKIVFDIASFDDDTKKIIKEIFFATPTRSFIEFKVDNDDTLELIYHKRGIYQDNTKRLGISLSRDRLSLLQNFKEPGDNNYISANFIFLVSKALLEKNIILNFKYDYMVGSGQIITKECNIEEIVRIGKQTDEEREREREKEEIKKQAELEVKKEKNNRRDSLPPDSTKEEALKNSGTMNKFSIEKANNIEDLEKQTDNILQNYKLVELEKTRIRLEEAEKMAINIHKDISQILSSGASIVEAINIANQKYNNKDAVNMASLFLTKDLLNISLKEKEISSLKEEISSLKEEKERLLENISQRENAIRELRENNKELEKQKEALKEENEKGLKILQEKYSSVLKSSQERYKDDLQKIVGAYEKQVDKLSGEQKSIKAELLLKEKENLELERKLKEANDSKNREINSNIQELQEKISALVNNTLNSPKLDKSINEKIENLEERINELKHYKKRSKGKKNNQENDLFQNAQEIR